MRFILYARASTKDRQHPEHQITELRDEAARRGWSIVAEVIERESGAKDNRPMWGAAVQRVLRGEADGIAAVELSRFGRSTSHLLEVAKALDFAGKHLVCTRQPIDSTTPMGRFVFTVLAAVYTFEREMIVERVTAGVRQAIKRRGGAWGRGRQTPPAPALELASRLLVQGYSLRKASRALAEAGFMQPASAAARSGHPRRPWPAGTLQDALARAEASSGAGGAG